MNTSEFLSAVLPDEGIYIVTNIDRQGGIQRAFVNSIDDIVELSKSRNGKVNIYHGCATYKNSDNRKKENVHKIQAFYIDSDIRPNPTPKQEGHVYKSALEALTGITKFLEDSRLPHPITVFSGSGLHYYWPLDKALDKDQWLPYANGLAKLAKTAGLKADYGITKDCARVLRTPGTRNLKRDDDCRILPDSRYKGPYNLSQFNILLFQNSKAIEVKRKYEKDANLETIVAKCSQIAQFKAGVEQTGETWIACGRVLAQCFNADASLWHEWSSRDERYNYDEAEKKWQDSINFNNAITCDRFKEVNPDGCKGCTQTCKSPVQLGKSDRIDIPDETFEDDEEIFQKATILWPFKISSSRSIICETKAGEDNEATTVEVSRYPFFVEDRAISELDATNNSFILRHHNPMDGWKRSEISFADFGTAPITALTKLGILVSNEKLAKDYIRISINELASKKKMTQKYDTFGWKGDKFLLGDKLLSYENNKFSIATVQLGENAITLAPHLRQGGVAGKGSFEGWRKAAQSLFAEGHEWQAITLLSAAGAPLLGLMGDAEGGTILSLSDPHGGTGKTTANTAGATLWGSWEGLSTNASDTMNARTAKLGTLRHLPFSYDEMKRDNPAIAKQFVQIFTAGTDRARLDKAASLSRSPKKWRTVMLTSANSELTGAIAADEGSEAMSDRVLEIQADQLPLSKKEINPHLKSEFMTNCGYAGPVIIGLILKHLDEVKKELIKKEKMYFDKLGNSKMRFRAQLLTIIDVVGTLLTKFNVLIFDVQYYIDWLLKKLLGEEEESRFKQVNAPELLSRFMRENQGSILYTNEYVQGTPKKIVTEPRSGKVVIRINQDTNHIIIPRRELQVWLQTKDQSITAFIKDMEIRGALEAKNIKRTLTAGTQLASTLDYVLIFRGNHQDLSGNDNVIPLEAPQSALASSLRLAVLRGSS